MNLKKVIEKVQGEYIRVESAWLKENAESLYDGILAQLDQFADDPHSPTSKEDVERWKKEGFMADIYFNEEELHTTAGFDVEELSNQPTWFVDWYEDYDQEELKNLLLQGVAELEGVIPPLLGVTDVARELGWVKGKVSEYRRRGILPEPATQIGGRPVWTKGQIDKFKEPM